MIHLLILVVHLLATIAKLVRPGAIRAIAFTSRSTAALPEKDLANRRPPILSLITLPGGTIAAVCSRCQSRRSLRIRHGQGTILLPPIGWPRLDPRPYQLGRFFITTKIS